MRTILQLLQLTLKLGILLISIYGIYLSFSASIMLGIINLVVAPAPFIIGSVKLAFGVDLAQKIVQALS